MTVAVQSPTLLSDQDIAEIVDNAKYFHTKSIGKFQRIYKFLSYKAVASQFPFDHISVSMRYIGIKCGFKRASYATVHGVLKSMEKLGIIVFVHRSKDLNDPTQVNAYALRYQNETIAEFHARVNFSNG